MNISPELIWFLIGLALILAEFMLPGIILVFFGAGAWVAAATAWLGITPGLTGQLAVFAVSSVVLLVLLRRWFKARFIGYVGDDHDPQDNIDEFRGQRVRVLEDLPGDGAEGLVEFKGARWKARSETAHAAGQWVRVDRADGITLLVSDLENQ